MEIPPVIQPIYVCRMLGVPPDRLGGGCRERGIRQKGKMDLYKNSMGSNQIVAQTIELGNADRRERFNPTLSHSLQNLGSSDGISSATPRMERENGR